jgi:diaminopimelate dehydrogenase
MGGALTPFIVLPVLTLLGWHWAFYLLAALGVVWAAGWYLWYRNEPKAVKGITAEELKRDHGGIPHGGCVIRTGKTGFDRENTHVVEYRLKLDSNPEFTSSVLVAYARAAWRMAGRGEVGCKTVLDVAPADLSPLSPEEQRAKLL